MRIVGIIPARYDSSRFPGKIIAKLAGKPVIYHVYQKSRKVNLIEDVFVATDDERIRSTVVNFGGKVIMTGNEHQSGTDRIAEAAIKIDCDIIVNIQGDEPLINPLAIARAIEPFLVDRNLVMTTLKKLITDPSELSNQNVVKVVTDLQGYALYFSRSPIPFKREWFEKGNISLKETPYKHIGLYVYTKDFLLELTQLPQTPLEKIEKLEQLRVLEHGHKIKVIETEYENVSIDTPEDLIKAENLFTQKDFT